MEKLIFIEEKNLNKKTRNIIEKQVVSIFVAIVTFLCIKDMLGISFVLINNKLGNPVSGFICTWNQIADSIGNLKYIILPKLEAVESSNVIFLLLVLMALWGINYIIIDSRKIRYILIIPTIILIFSLWFELFIDINNIILLAISIMIGIIYMKNGGNAFFENILLVILTTAIVVGSLQLPVIENINARNGMIGSINRYVSENLSNWYYGENPLKNGDLTQTKRADDKGEALEITMQEPQSIYLRGFVGETYTNNKWDTLSPSSYYSGKNLFYWLDKSGFNYWGQIQKAEEITSNEERKNTKKENQVNIDVKKADKRYAYIPYEIQSNQIERGKEWNGSFITSTKGTWLDEYNYKISENVTSQWTDIAAKVFVQSNFENKKLDEYLINESYYNEYVYNNYTYISDNDRSLLRRYIGKSGNQTKGHIDYKLAIDGIQDYLNEKFIYTENLGVNEEKKNALENFFTSKKGYDIHFATAATLIFRYYGIPARYIEGYLITPEDIKNNDKTIVIPKSNAHAWVEIYVDGIGFVPIEVSPPYKNLMEEADMKIGISNNSLVRTFEENGGNNNQIENLQPAGDDKNQFKSLLKIVLLIILLILLAIILFKVIRKVTRLLLKSYNQQKLFKKGEHKLAVSAIYGYMEMKNYTICERTRELGNRAAYSTCEISKEEHVEMLKELKIRKNESRRNAKKQKFVFYLFNSVYAGLIRVWKQKSRK